MVFHDSFWSVSFSRFLILTGFVLMAIAVTNPEWKTFGHGKAGVLEGCGCRNIGDNCRFSGLHEAFDSTASGDEGDVRQALFTGTKCDTFQATRWLSVISVLFVYIGVYTLIYRESFYFRAPKISPTGRPRNPIEAGYQAATDGVTFAADTGRNVVAGVTGQEIPPTTLGWWGTGFILVGGALGVIVAIIFSVTVSNTGSHTSDLGWGFIVYTSGASIAIGFWGIYGWMFSRKYTVTQLPFLNWVHDATGWTIHAVMLLALILMACGVASSHWATPKIHEDFVVVPEFERTVNDTYANVGILNRTGTTFETNALTIITTPVGAEAPNRQMEFGHWDICLCQEMKLKCQWSQVKLFSGDIKCGASFATRFFAWLSLVFAFIAFLPFSAVGSRFGAWLTHSPLWMAFITSFLTLLVFGLIWDEKNAASGHVNGWAYKAYASGAGALWVGLVMAAMTETATGARSKLADIWKTLLGN